MSNTRLYWLHCLSPTHAGVGRGVGYIDLPIDRDGITGWPIIRGSSFKGVWADHHRATNEARKLSPLLKAAFGIAGDNDNSNAGALIPTDAKLVCLPVRSFRGTFAWTTSPLCLQLLNRMATLAGVGNLPGVPGNLLDNHAHLSNETEATSLLKEGSSLYLEDLDLEAKSCATAAAWAKQISCWVFPNDPVWQKHFRQRFVVVSDMVFDFLSQTGTEVHTRVKISDDTKTVERGALWTEESLPTESILAGVIQCERVFLPNGTADASITGEQLIADFATKAVTLQIGGKASVGRGQVRCHFSSVDGANS